MPELNDTLENHHIWFNVNDQGVPTPVGVPGPTGAGVPALLGLAGAWFYRRIRSVAAA
jgi:MYXO-CTERM domain-containing protein